MINSFLANLPMLCLLQTSNLWISGIFRGYEMRILIRNGLNYAISTSACGNILNKQGITKLQIYFSKKKFREEKTSPNLWTEFRK